MCSCLRMNDDDDDDDVMMMMVTTMITLIPMLGPA